MPNTQLVVLAEAHPLRTYTVGGRELHFLGEVSAPAAQRWTQVVGDTLAYYARFYQRPYSFGQLSVVEPQYIGGGIAAFAFPGLLTTELNRSDQLAYRDIAHELGHEWWGSTIPMTGGGKMFLQEALTEYNAWKAKDALGYTNMQSSVNGLMGDTQFQQLMVKFASHQPWEPLYYGQALDDARAIGGGQPTMAAGE